VILHSGKEYILPLIQNMNKWNRSYMKKRSVATSKICMTSLPENW